VAKPLAFVVVSSVWTFVVLSELSRIEYRVFGAKPVIVTFPNAQSGALQLELGGVPILTTRGLVVGARDADHARPCRRRGTRQRLRRAEQSR
jgi:hypothetical protein